MGFFWLELVVAALAAKRGWRVTLLVLLALPFAVTEAEPFFVALLGPVLAGYFDPATTSQAIAHGIALVGLAVAACADAEEPLSRGASLRSRPVGPLYQI